MYRILFSLVLTLSYVQAEDGERGRLPDGRAFRTDSDGTQLVDYIAELELQVETLTRQVHGLEDESQARQAVIDRLRAGGAESPQLRETDLTRKNPAPATPCEPKIVERVVEKVIETKAPCLPSACPECDDSPDCNLMIEQAKLEQSRADQAIIEDKEKEIAALKTQLSEVVARQGSTIVSESRAIRAVSPVRQKAVESLRNTMLRDLKSLEDLLAYRDKLLARMNRSGREVIAEVPVKETRLQLETAESVAELSRIRQRMNEMRGKVQKEIAIYKRELKIR